MRIRLGSSKIVLALMARLLSLSCLAPIWAGVPHDGNLDFTVLHAADVLRIPHRAGLASRESGPVEFPFRDSG